MNRLVGEVVQVAERAFAGLVLVGWAALGVCGLAVAETVKGPQAVSVAVRDIVGAVEGSHGGITRYQAYDGYWDANRGTGIVYMKEHAMRYDLRSVGTVRWLEACFQLSGIAAVNDYVFDFAVYSDETRTLWNEDRRDYDSGSRPGTALYGPQEVRTLLPFDNRETDQDYECVMQSVEVPVQRGPVWVAVRMPGYELRKQLRIPEASLGLEERHTDVDDPNWRRRNYFAPNDADSWWPVFQHLVIFGDKDNRLFIRMGVEHERSTDHSSPLSPGQHTDCHPTSTPLLFEGDYKVSLCYETADGGAGEAKGGIWASGQAGLLWFFDRGNAEVLIKVLDGCAHNDRRWVFVAPVTDVAFNLHVTDSRGLLWTHRNRLGVTAAARSDTNAFPCE